MARLDKQEENLIDLAAEGGSSVAKVRQRLAEIHRKRDQLTARMADKLEQLEVGAKLIEGALQLLRDPLDLYLRMSPEGQRMMNQAVFERLYVFDGEVTEVVFNAPFGDLVGAQELLRSNPDYRRETPLPEFDWSFCQAGPEDFSGPLAEVLLVDGLSKGVMVGTEGFEPSLEAV